MKFADKLKKAMIDKNISSNKELSEQCGVSYYIINRLLRDDCSCRLGDLVIVDNYLNSNVFNTTKAGENNEKIN